MGANILVDYTIVTLGKYFTWCFVLGLISMYKSVMGERAVALGPVQVPRVLQVIKG